MLVKKGEYHQTSLYPNTNWLGEGYFIIDETTEQGKALAEKITQNSPYYELIIEGDRVIDVVLTEKPEPEPITPMPTQEERLEALEMALLLLL